MAKSGQQHTKADEGGQRPAKEDTKQKASSQEKGSGQGARGGAQSGSKGAPSKAG